MNILNRVLTIACCAVLIGAVAFAGDIKSSGKKGVWSADSTWIGGVQPGAADNVTIADGDTVTFGEDTVVVNNLTVGETSGPAMLQFPKTHDIWLWVNGNIVVNANCGFRTQTRSSLEGDLVHTIFLYGNLTHNGTVLDFRSGSTNSTGAVGNFQLLGSADQTLTVSTLFSTSNGEFNGIRVNKSGSGSVILGSDIQLAGGSSSNDTTYPYLYLTRGKVYTGNYALIHRYASNTGSVAGGSDSSYVIGAMGRGMGNSGSAIREFPIGDSLSYRPVTVRSTTGGSSTGHYIKVRAIHGNANTGSSTFSPSIDKVASVRYFQVTYVQQGGAATMGVDRFKIGYGTDDGVGTGNDELRIAFSTNDRAAWTGGAQTVPDTTFTPDAALQDSIAAVTLANNGSMFIALARLAGTTSNSLNYTTSVGYDVKTPATWSLEQNYPNPFNPETEIRYSTLKAGEISLSVYNILGQRIASLVSTAMEPGTHTARWNGRDDAGRVMPSGVYIYKLEGPGFVQARRMVLMK